jgi:hypothetical protein
MSNLEPYSLAADLAVSHAFEAELTASGNRCSITTGHYAALTDLVSRSCGEVDTEIEKRAARSGYQLFPVASSPELHDPHTTQF